MSAKIQDFLKNYLKKDLPNIRPGDTVRIFQKIQEENKGKKKRGRGTQLFEGVVIAKKHGKGISSTITVRKIISGVGVERIFPIHSPLIEKIEIVKRAKVRRAKLYYLRTAKGRKARLKNKELAEAIVWEENKEEDVSNQIKEENISEENKKIEGEKNKGEKEDKQKEEGGGGSEKAEKDNQEINSENKEEPAEVANKNEEEIKKRK